ncbi:MAG: type II toxin-antitoxin system VapC family toxin [Verrucomicrobia bacterium]|nr:type II toxin-antitoxin system VapC family toxin [Verrucomicrobiota bacterium]MCH8527834.1 type II toxin-antitoxin system VapC family toxin [Kiritimatiellia bacterium]
MKPFAETSFLCSLYRQDLFSASADRWFRRWSKPLDVSTLVLFEFRQSIRLHTRLFESNPDAGLSVESATHILRDQQKDLRDGVWLPRAVDWSCVHKTAEELSDKYTWEVGHRFADILHVATALCLDADTFLTFDSRQRRLAESEGMKVPFSDED